MNETTLAQPFKPRINKINLIGIVGVHLAALGAIFFFSWANLAVCLFGLFVVAPIGINVGYHRLLTHQSFTAPRWLRNTLAFIGAIVGGGPPLYWVAMHRVHHRFSDTDKDPHNSRLGFWHSHLFHLFYTTEHEADGKHLERYAPDLTAEPFMVWLDKYWLWPALAVLPILYAFGGWGFVFWGAFVRLVLTWHIMWFVNSASHMWGYRNYDTRDNTVNCWWVGLLAAGEGWHNNHHHQPSCAAHGHKWWEFDLSFMIIRLFEKLGWAKGVKRPVLKTESVAP